VNAAAATLMSAFNSINGVPASANPFTLTQVLRKEWGFRGVVDSDWTSVVEIRRTVSPRRGPRRPARAFWLALMWTWASSLYHDHLAELIRSGQIPQANVDEAVRRVLRLKFALGLFERPYTDEAHEAERCYGRRATCWREPLLSGSLVLLKNDLRA